MGAEKAIAEPGGHAAGMLWDITKFYEHFIHAELVRKGVKLGFDIRILRVASVHYRSPRYVALGGFVCGGLAATRGVFAGCNLATTWVNVYTIEECDMVVARFPASVFDFYVDDWQAAATGSEDHVAGQITQVAEVFKDQIEWSLGCSVAVDKAAVVASSPRLAARISRSLKELGGDGSRVVKNLGIDYSSGRHRSFCAKATTRAKRFQGLKGSAKRLKALVGAAGNKASKVFVAGFKPSVGFGMEVWGCEPRELFSLQRKAVSCYAPHSKGSSLHMKLVLYGDPVAPLAVAASSRYAQEVWNAGADRHGRGVSLPELGQVWRAVQPLVPGLRWPFARGPMAICLLELQRVGWSMRGPYTFVGEHGLAHSLIERSPRLVMQDLQAAHHRMLARRVASKPGYQELEGLRVAPEVMQKVLRSKMLSPLEKGSLRCWLAGGLWIQQRLIQAGYLVDKCKLCEAEVDTPYHRIF